MYPKNKIYIFSKVSDDPSLADLFLTSTGLPLAENKRPIVVQINEDLVNNPINIMEDIIPFNPDTLEPQQFDGCLVLFDDIDTVSQKDQAKALTDIINDILEIGRHNNISCIITSHLINGNDRKRTRTILNETHRCCLFPRCSTSHAVTYYLSQYCGIKDKPTVQKILDAPSRYVCIHNRFPQYVLHARGAFVL